MELNKFFLKFFVSSSGFIRRDTGGLANEAFTSNPIVSLKQQFSSLKATKCLGS